MEQNQKLIYGSAQDGSIGGRFDLGPLLNVIFQRIWIVLAVALIIAGGGSLFALKQPNIYKATAVIQVATEEQKIVNIDDVSRDELRSVEALNTIAQRLKHSSVLARVVRTNNLVNNPAFLTEKGKPTEAQLIGLVGNLVEIKVRNNTRLIEISVQYRDPKVVDVIANSVARQFIRDNLDQKLQINQAANTVLIEEAERLRKQLETSERSLQAYKETNKTASLEDQQNIVLESMKKFNVDFNSAKSERLLIESDLQRMKEVGDDPKLLIALPSVQSDPGIQSMRALVHRQFNYVT